MKRYVLFAALAALTAVITLIPGIATAQGGESVTSTVRYDDPETGERMFAEGVAVVVTDESGNVVGEATTDAEGTFVVELPHCGTDD